MLVGAGAPPAPARSMRRSGLQDKVRTHPVGDAGADGSMERCRLCLVDNLSRLVPPGRSALLAQDPLPVPIFLEVRGPDQEQIRPADWRADQPASSLSDRVLELMGRESRT
jgi:hypothetical protein